MHLSERFHSAGIAKGIPLGKYVEFVFRQDQQSFVRSHIKMFEFFGGVSEEILLDNLKTGVIKADLYDPTLNRTYQEMAHHYGCFCQRHGFAT
jgi:transposase